MATRTMTIVFQTGADGKVADLAETTERPDAQPGRNRHRYLAWFDISRGRSPSPR